MAYITRTTGTPTDRKKFTYSAWLKIANMESYQRPIQNYVDSSNRGYILYHHNTDANPNTWFFYDRISSQINFQATSVAKYRDTNAFYHLVVRADTTQSTQADRYRVYINGEQIDLSITHNIGQNVDLGFNSSSANLRIGGQESGSQTWKGIMSHVHFCDGYSYAPTEFGSTDATTGEWKINTSPSVTYGNNGYFVFKDDNAVTDRSGQGNNFTLSGSITKTEDNPSNVFATLNPLNNYTSQVFANGNTTVGTTSGNTSHKQFVSTLGISSGKYYWELKNIDATTTDSRVGISSENVISNPANLTGSDGHVGDDPESYGYVASSGNKETNNSQSSYDNSFTSGDILMIALDMDNNKLYFGKNGTWQNSGDPTSGATGTGATFTVTSNLTYFPAVSIYGASEDYSFNFGNGYFGTTAVSSAGTNASGIGIFEYDVPNGFTALSTKGLNL
jgi:hypothetical protein